MSYHAKLSPSSAHRWSVCTAAPGAEEGLTDNGNDAARWGTTNHLLSSTCLENGREPVSYLNDAVFFCSTADGKRIEVLGLNPPDADLIARLGDLQFEHHVEIDQEQVDCATTYVTYVRTLHAQLGGELHIEQRLPIGHITGEEGATGSGDAVIVTDKVIHVVDLKAGMGFVEVRDNPQLAMYAAGAREKFDVFGEVETIRTTIVQPRLGGEPRTAEFTVADLEEQTAPLTEAAFRVHNKQVEFVPGEKQCHFCKAKPTCAAAQDYALADMPDMDGVRGRAPIFLKLKYIRDWCDSVESSVRDDLTAGVAVSGLKLIEGKLGARSWKSPEAAEKVLVERFRLKADDAYKRTLITPADAEKLAASGAIGKRQWAALQEEITQARNKPSIVADTDPRPALAGAADDMPDLETDLFND